MTEFLVTREMLQSALATWSEQTDSLQSAATDLGGLDTSSFGSAVVTRLTTFVENWEGTAKAVGKRAEGMAERMREVDQGFHELDEQCSSRVSLLQPGLPGRPTCSTTPTSSKFDASDPYHRYGTPDSRSQWKSEKAAEFASWLGSERGAVESATDGPPSPSNHG